MFSLVLVWVIPYGPQVHPIVPLTFTKNKSCSITERLATKCRGTKIIATTNQNKVDNNRSQWEFKENTSTPLQARENLSAHSATGFSIVSHWLTCHEIFLTNQLEPFGLSNDGITKELSHSKWGLSKRSVRVTFSFYQQRTSLATPDLLMSQQLAVPQGFSHVIRHLPSFCACQSPDLQFSKTKKRKLPSWTRDQ